MSKEDIIRAWKDPEYRDNLSEEQQSQLPENPAGVIEFPDEKSQTIAGGARGRRGGKQEQTYGGFTCGIRKKCGGTINFTNGPFCRILRL